MKKQLLRLILGLTLLLFTAVPALALSLEFANLDNSTLAFSGGSFSFSNNSGGYDFQLMNGSGYVDPQTVAALGPDLSIAINGNIFGTFTLGPINNGQAEVSGTGTLNLVDTQGQVLSANLAWVDIASLGNDGAILNSQAAVNLSGVVYNGANQDFAELKTGAIGVLTFPFGATISLDDLGNGPDQLTSYCMTIAPDPPPVPIPPGLLLFGSGLAAMVVWRRRSRWP